MVEVPLPRHDLPRLFSKRRDLLADDVKAWEGHTLLGGTYEQFVQLIASKLPHSIPFIHLYESLRWLLGQPLTRYMLEIMAWQMVGNLHVLPYRAAPRWTRQMEDEWAPLQILKAEPGLNFYDERGAFITAICLAGSCAGLETIFFWTQKKCRAVAYLFGFHKHFSKVVPKMRLSTPEQLTRLRLYGYIEASRSDTKPKFQEIRVPESMLQYNLEILHLRFRKGQQCPQGFHHACHKCAVGYDICPGGTHPVSYQLQSCDQCGQPSYFDPTRSAEKCVVCLTKAAYVKKSQPA